MNYSNEMFHVEQYKIFMLSYIFFILIADVYIKAKLDRFYLFKVTVSLLKALLKLLHYKRI